MALRTTGAKCQFPDDRGRLSPGLCAAAVALPTLNRLAISMWAGNPRLSAEACSAITSNTVQFGAKVDSIIIKVFNVYGFISLDALIQFDPFTCRQVAGEVAVRRAIDLSQSISR
jgi:hypothetical protein